MSPDSNNTLDHVKGDANLVTVDLWESGSPAYTIPTPTEVLGSFSEATSLTWRFPDEALAAPIAKDNKAEDELLTDYISRCRMHFHFDACKQLAGDAVEEANKEREEKEKARKEAVRALAERDAELRNKGKGAGLVGELGENEVFYLGEGLDGVEVDVDEEGEEVLTQEHLDAIAEETGMDVDRYE